MASQPPQQQRPPPPPPPPPPSAPGREQEQQQRAPPAALPMPKTILLVTPERQHHGLIQKLRAQADVVKLQPNIDPADAVFAYRSRSVGLLLLSATELKQHPQLVLERVKAFHAKSSQHPCVLLISQRRDQTPPEWYMLQEETVAMGRLAFLLAKDLEDAASAVGGVLAVLRDDRKRQRQNDYFLELIRAAASPSAAEGVLLGLWKGLGIDEKELWRILSVYDSLGRVAAASTAELLEACPIDRSTAQLLGDFLDGRPRPARPAAATTNNNSQARGRF